MLKVYGRATSVNVQKVMWCVGELGLAHERLDYGGRHGKLDTPEFLAMNPNKRVPTIDDGGVVVWESNAIVRYLAARYGTGSLWAEDPGERAEADQWMDWMQTTLAPDFYALFWGLVRTPAAQQDAKAIAATAERLGEHYRLLDRVLAAQPWLAGEHLTMADFPAGCTLYRYFDLPIERPKLPHLEAWYATLKERPAYREHVMVSYAELRV